MSNKMTCPGCKSHTSAVMMAAREGDACPYCGNDLSTSTTWRDEAIEALMDAGYISRDYPESAAAAVDLVASIALRGDLP